MPLGIKQYLQVPTSTIPKEGSTTSHMHLTFYSNINSVVGDLVKKKNSVVGAYHYLVPAGVGNKAR
jgi:hypothetical protein